jgi:ABC-type nickel/cobalt efflux system permease component RcnA
MREILFFVVSSFWAGAAHAATPGHGKTIAAAYIVGARGKDHRRRCASATRLRPSNVLGPVDNPP